MCYSTHWEAEADRKRREAQARDAHERRAGMIETLRTEAEKHADKASKDIPKVVPAK